jgi:hypothetical protein
MGFTKSKELRFSKTLPCSFILGSAENQHTFKQQRNVKLFVVKMNAQRRAHSLTPCCCSANSRKGREKNTTLINISILAQQQKQM